MFDASVVSVVADGAKPVMSVAARAPKTMASSSELEARRFAP
jgi:hypothetical protein